MIDLSVLICSTHTRYQTFGRSIQDQVWSQYAALLPVAQECVEILMLTDNKKMMLGHKRNVMVDMAQGRYVVFVDDDDRLEPDYLSSLLAAVCSDADVITFLVSVSINGGKSKPCKYSKHFTHNQNLPDLYERLPNHICVVKRELASQVSFPSVMYGEDAVYGKLLTPLLKTEHHIPRVLYHYDSNSATSETQEYRKGPMRRRTEPPVVDVIILSKANTEETWEMTQNTIDTCISGADSMPVNVIVMEQHPGMAYSHALTVLMPMMSEFNYNAFANEGARMGTAPWIMVANNDLIFHDGWLHHLLAADHPLVSPKCPVDSRQADVTENTTGSRIGRHLSGWCYMISRELWEKIGGFDECVRFWCSDDVVVQQVKAEGVKPMLVPEAKVAHLRSVTLNGLVQEVVDELTWGQLDIFIDKYGSHRLGEHPEYLRWKKAHDG